MASLYPDVADHLANLRLDTALQDVVTASLSSREPDIESLCIPEEQHSGELVTKKDEKEKDQLRTKDFNYHKFRYKMSEECKKNVRPLLDAYKERQLKFSQKRLADQVEELELLTISNKETDLKIQHAAQQLDIQKLEYQQQHKVAQNLETDCHWVFNPKYEQEYEEKKQLRLEKEASVPVPIYVHPTRLTFYNKMIDLYTHKLEIVKPFKANKELKEYRTICQWAINLPLNTISAPNPHNIQGKFENIYNFFNGQAVTMRGQSITINDHPLARDYCLLLVAMKFVSQCDMSISSNSQAAFPFASVIVTLWKLLPDFGELFLACMYKDSPFLVPYVIPQKPNQDKAEYLHSIGYRLFHQNFVEEPDMYLKRQLGLARLYAAIMITPGRMADGPYHCFGIEEGWRWLSHFVMVHPLPNVSATLLTEMLRTLGYNLYQTYGKQFVKLLVYIDMYYLPKLSAYGEGGPKVRLNMILAKFLHEQTILQVAGVLPTNFW